MIFCGIDPGKSGGIAFIGDDGSVLETMTMPLIDKEDIDGRSVWGRINHYCLQDSVIVYLEKVHSMPGQGVSSMFSFGKSFGMMICAVQCSQASLVMIPPQTWSKVMHEGISKDKEPKDRSLVAVKNLYPNLDLRNSERCKKPDSGRVDAVLMAAYGWRKYRG